MAYLVGEPKPARNCNVYSITLVRNIRGETEYWNIINALQNSLNHNIETFRTYDENNHDIWALHVDFQTKPSKKYLIQLEYFTRGVLAAHNMLEGIIDK